MKRKNSQFKNWAIAVVTGVSVFLVVLLVVFGYIEVMKDIASCVGRAC